MKFETDVDSKVSMLADSDFADFEFNFSIWSP